MVNVDIVIDQYKHQCITEELFMLITANILTQLTQARPQIKDYREVYLELFI